MEETYLPTSFERKPNIYPLVFGRVSTEGTPPKWCSPSSSLVGRMAFREIDNRIIVLLERVKINLIWYSYTLDWARARMDWAKGTAERLKWQYEHNNNNERSVDEDIDVAFGFLGQTSNGRL